MFYLGDSDFCVIDNSTVSITDWIISYCGIQVSDRGVSLFYTLPVKTESEISNKEGSSGNATVEFLFHLGAEYLARWVLSFWCIKIKIIITEWWTDIYIYIYIYLCIGAFSLTAIFHPGQTRDWRKFLTAFDLLLPQGFEMVYFQSLANSLCYYFLWI